MAVDLPHKLIITGSGFDPNEFFNGCNTFADVDGPGGAGSRGLAPNEDALSVNLNRSAYALAKNDEYLAGLLGGMSAYGRVAVLAGFTGGDQIDIDPSGGAGGDINYTGYLYLGNGTNPIYSIAQEGYDALFQLLDEDYNEVMVDGVEVKIDSISGVDAVLGNGFVDTLVSLHLNKTLPTANYRLAYWIGADYDDLPEDYLVTSEVRGLHEAAAEVTRKSWFVCDDATPEEVADFASATAIQDAIDNLGENTTLYVRAGSYDIHAAGASGTDLSIGVNNLTIIGEGAGTVFNLAATRRLLISSCNHIHIENVAFNPAGTGADCFITDCYNVYMKNCSFTNMKFSISDVTSKRMVFENCTFGGSDMALNILDYVSQVKFINCTFIDGTDDAAEPIVKVKQSSKISFDNCSIRNTAGSSAQVSLLLEDVKEIAFNSCEIIARDGPVILYGEDPSPVSWVSASFIGCEITGYGTLIRGASLTAPFQYAKLHFENCRFANLSTTAVDKILIDLKCHTSHTTSSSAELRSSMINCHIYDSYNMGREGGTTNYPVIDFRGVYAKGLSWDHRGSTNFYQNGPRLRIAWSTVIGLDIELEPSPTIVSTSPDNGMIDVREGGRLKDLEVRWPTGVWQYPLLYIAGDMTSDPEDPHYAEVEDVTISVLDDPAKKWGLHFSKTTDGVIATMGSCSRLSRLRTPDYLLLTDTVTNPSTCLIYIGGDGYATLEHCYLKAYSHTSAGPPLFLFNGSAVLAIVFVAPSSAGVPQIRIIDNTLIAMKDYIGAQCNNLLYIKQGSVGVIRGNSFSWDTNCGAAPATADIPVVLDTSTTLWVFDGNHVKVGLENTPGQQYVVEMLAGALTGAPTGGCNATGNILLLGLGSGQAANIWYGGGAVAGDTTNVKGWV